MESWRPYREYDTVLIVNFGGQYTHLIARRVRELNVYSEVVHYADLTLDVIEEVRPRAIILSGGPKSVYDPDSPRPRIDLLKLDIPILGICYGFQLLAHLLGGIVKPCPKGEYGGVRIRLVENDVLFKGWDKEEPVWMSHGDCVVEPPKDSRVLAFSENGYIAAFKLRDRPIYGIQFHPEVRHTPKGIQLLRNFIVEIAGCRQNWIVENLIDRLVKEIRETVGKDEKVLCAVSGGVDSSVTAVLVKRAIGDRLIAVFVNHGLFREGEVEEVLSLLSSTGLNVRHINASKRFLERLRGVKDPEEKRRIIGEEFARIFREIIESDPSIKWLAQGTTYPDVIESGAVPGADRIKSHHNVAGIPSWFDVKILEPLRYFYKDEVRRLGRALGLPDGIIKRHPFPGPGLAVRIIGEITEEKLMIARRAGRIVEEVLKKYGLYDRVWQAFAVVGDDMWVGVKGDRRAVGYIVTVRIVESDDGMTADWAKLPYEVLDEIAKRITGEIPNVVMVTYAITTKPPATIEPQ